MRPRDYASRPAARPASAALGLLRRRSGLVVGGLVVLVVLGLIALFWHLLTDKASVRREVSAPPMLMLPPPPPPPPPQEKPPEPQPEKVKPEVVEPKPADPVEPPKDDTPPSPTKDLGDAVTINGDAQAGTDAFGIGAGSGGGMTGGGGGLGSRSYSAWLASSLQQAFGRDPRTRTLAFDDVRVDLWLDADGRATRAQLIRGTGNPGIDEAVLAMLRDFHADEKPPASLRYPLSMSIRGRRP
ncbi:energy transducer TonB [Pandoraea sp. CB10b_02]|uniref:energy transducer TonB family protein n=1 Tax=Pandoraea sp. CB10b_02 TaxID=2014535 RepID=UPI00257BBC92|nr:energy transducer TonB [Pandoraea sp. CB10b_02]